MHMSKHTQKLQQITNRMQAVIADIAEKEGVIVTRVLTTSTLNHDGELTINVNMSSVAMKKVRP